MKFDKEKHPFYRYVEMNEVELSNELKNWSRQDLIDWLSWNDRNGIYKDEESIEEIGQIMTYEEGFEIMLKQIIYDNENSL